MFNFNQATQSPLFLITLAAFATLLVLSLLQYYIFRARLTKLAALTLRPNCLLTRYPIVFLSGPKSPFYLLSYWNLIPRFLREHGYEVEVLDLRFRDSKKRLAMLVDSLKHQATPCHLICDASMKGELRELKETLNVLGSEMQNRVRSTTVVECSERHNTRRLTLEDLLPEFPYSGIQTWSLNPALRSYRSPFPDGETGSPVRITSQWLYWNALECLQVTMIKLHNLTGLALGRFTLASTDHGGPRPLNAVEVGAAGFATDWQIEQKFLDLAISLAEGDAR